MKSRISSAGNDLPLAPGMAFSIEPGIYFPGSWARGSRDIVVVTDDGVLAVNNRPHELIVVARVVAGGVLGWPRKHWCRSMLRVASGICVVV